MKGFFVIVITALALGWLRTRVGKAKAREVNGVWIFPPAHEVQALYILVFALGCGLSAWGLFGPVGDRQVMLTGGLLIALFPLLVWPKRITVSDEALTQRNWLGRLTVINRVELSNWLEEKKGVTIRSISGAKIVFSEFHADRSRFLVMLQQSAPRNTSGRDPKGHSRSNS
jgi:hypothetical protein